MPVPPGMDAEGERPTGPREGGGSASQIERSEM